ncbi:YbaB/EbfC family nucleoid-associated protein [Nocardia lasii]|uniref:YbaB/EbfC family nucleoid-associated protein n=1 Tax=Nocardia lasii TaxID=1616107 RepID=A0ABW1JPZ1_9NOCA
MAKEIGILCMATQGWYNHYDDPDEFWDEAPLRAVQPIPNRSDGRGPEATTSTRNAYSSPTPDEPIRGPSESAAPVVASRYVVEAAVARYTSTSRDGLATATVSSDGSVRDIYLPKGFGNRNLPDWQFSNEVDFIARAIVQAVNMAKERAEYGLE